MRIPLETFNKVNSMVGAFNAEIAGVRGLDESEADQKTSAPGEVLLRDEAATVELSFDPATGAPRSFTSETFQDVVTPSGELLAFKGTKATYHKDEQGAEHFQNTLPLGDGQAVLQTLTIDNQNGFVDYNEFKIRL